MLGKLRVRFVFALASGLGAFACAVYDGSLLPAGQGSNGDAGQSDGGSSASSGGGDGGATAGGSDSSAGAENDMMAAAGDDSSGDAGGTSNGGAPSTAGMANGGHAGALGGSSGNAASAGAIGSGGAVGSAGAIGSAGALGVAGAIGSGGAVETGGAVGVAGASGGGVAGGGGGVSVVMCADHPLNAKSGWIATASSQSSTPKNPPSALVDNMTARWSSGKPQSGDEWIQVDFGATVNLRSVNLQQGADTNDYPRSYAVIVSDTKNDLTGVVRASGVGTSGVTTTILLPKVFSGRYLLLKQLGSSLSWWSVAEVEVSCVDGR
jgi:hypothetical protein